MKLSIKIEINSENLAAINTKPVEEVEYLPVSRQSDKKVDVVAIALAMFLGILLFGGTQAVKNTSVNIASKQGKTTAVLTADKLRQDIATEALKRVRNKENFRPGVSAQCMFWVRSVLESKGINLPVSQQPFDELVRGNVAAPGMAQSLSGADIGKQIYRIQDLMPGDLVFYLDTYGNDPEGSITHVGFFVGNKKIAHRPTASGRVKLDSVTKYKFGVGVRIHDKFLRGVS